MKSHLSTIELRKLRSKLPHGSITRISDELGLDISTVSKVLKGEFQNTDVIDAAIKIVEEQNEKIRLYKARLNSL